MAVALALGYFDHAGRLIERAAALGLDRESFPPAGAMRAASRAYGRRVAAARIRASLRGLVPLARSYLRGI